MKTLFYMITVRSLAEKTWPFLYMHDFFLRGEEEGFSLHESFFMDISALQEFLFGPSFSHFSILQSETKSQKVS